MTYWNLLAKSLSGNSLPGEKESLAALLHETDGHQETLDDAKRLWEECGKLSDIEKYDPGQALKKVHDKLEISIPNKQSRGTKTSYRQFLRIAAAILLAVGLGILGRHLGHQYPNQLIGNWITIESHDEIIADMALPDGSKIDLNGHSKIMYPSNFAKNERKLYFSGEAFFDVRADKEKPFIIVTDKIKVKVLGTSFNVKSYKKDENARVAVKSGNVAVSENAILKLSRQGVEVGPGYEAKFKGKGNEMEVGTYPKNNFLAWQSKNFTFNNTPLDEVSDLLESVYLVEINIQNEEVKHLRLTASFQNQELELILRVIEKTFNLKVEKEQGRISLNK